MIISATNTSKYTANASAAALTSVTNMELFTVAKVIIHILFRLSGL